MCRAATLAIVLGVLSNKLWNFVSEFTPQVRITTLPPSKHCARELPSLPLTRQGSLHMSCPKTVNCMQPGPVACAAQRHLLWGTGRYGAALDLWANSLTDALPIFPRRSVELYEEVGKSRKTVKVHVCLLVPTDEPVQPDNNACQEWIECRHLAVSSSLNHQCQHEAQR